MEYLQRQVEERLNPKTLAPWAKTMIVLALKSAGPLRPLPATGDPGPVYRLAAYARGEDYHLRAWRLLKELETYLQTTFPMQNDEGGQAGPRLRGFVDTSPVFERDFAAAAGLGWRAKNCTLIHRDFGSNFLLMGALTDWELPASAPVPDFCGRCTRCLDACPTQAFQGPGEIDARLCISYWTIEHRGAMPEGLSERFGSWIFGCDVCQSVCPWNNKHLNKAADTNARAGDPTDAPADPYERTGLEWLRLLKVKGGFQSRFKGTPMMRAGRKGLLRNVATAAANQGDATVLPMLRQILAEETDAMLVTALGKAIDSLSSKPDAKA